MKNKLGLLLEGVETKRFHSVRTTKIETVGHHSSVVAGILFLLWPDCSRDLLINAVYHDVAECKTGDIPSPSKRKFIDREKMNKHEDQIFVDHGIDLPSLSVEDKRRLKIADILSGISFCVQEYKIGNTFIKEAMTNFVSYFHEMGPHETVVMEAFDSLVGPKEKLFLTAA